MWPFGRTAADGSGGQQGQRVLSILSPDEVAALGELPGQAIAGILVGDAWSLEAFRPNRVFVDFMHEVLRTFGPDDPGLQRAAAEQGDGFVAILDGRTPTPQGAVPPEDIIGGFDVRDGRIVPGSYRASPNHRVFTARGLVQLPPSLRDTWARALKGSR
jgi:hypothetical protein